jgi:uncharacterized protein (TIGR02118 family)
MVKQVLLLPRRPGLSPQKFHDHWRHPHATMARRIRTLCGYVQNHRLDTPALGPEQVRYDGVVEAWFESEESARSVVQDPIYAGFLAEDELNFIDHSGMQGMLVDEEALASAPGAENGEADAFWDHAAAPLTIKILQFVREQGEQPWADDGDAGRARRLGALHGVRSRPAGSAGDWGDGTADQTFLGIHELWWPTVSAFERGIAAAPEEWRWFLKRPARALTLLTQAERVV